MPNPPFTHTPPLAESWSEVRSRNRVVRYRRSGAGRAVLVLRSPHDDDPLWTELLHELRCRFRVIVPEPPREEGDAAAWLADFLEGLGMSSVALVASSSFCVAALELALLESEQVGCVVLVANEKATPPLGVGQGELVFPTLTERVGLLVVRRGLHSETVVPLVCGFLSEGRSGTS